LLIFLLKIKKTNKPHTNPFCAGAQYKIPIFHFVQVHNENFFALQLFEIFAYLLICLFAYLFICLFVYLFICLFVYLNIYLSKYTNMLQRRPASKGGLCKG